MNNKQKYRNISIALALGILLFLPLYIFVELNFRTDNNNNGATAQYVGRTTCLSCHEEECRQWKGSHHDRSMDLAADSTVLGNFDHAELESNGRTHKFYKKDDRFYVFTDGENGEMQEFEIKYVFGFTPLQQYLVEFDHGRFQVLPLTWNTINKNWYHMADSI